MSFDKIQQMISSLAKSLDDNEKVAIPVLSTKLSRYAGMYPGDQTLGMMNRVIEKMAENNNIFIRKSELKSLYNKFYSRDSKFAELFKDELGIVVAEPDIKKYERDDAGEIDIYGGADPILSNALNSLFDNSPVKMYSQALAKDAIKSVSASLDAWNVRPTSINVEDGNSKLLMLQANYETPKGITSVYIPIEINGNKVLEASAFIGNAGPTELNHLNIKNYIISNAGNSLKATASTILNVLTDAISEKREISDAELALTRLNASRHANSEFAQGQIVGQKMAEASIKDVELPKSNEFESFEKTFTSPHGMATFAFGANNVKIGRELITREVSGYGYKNVQVAVSKTDKDTIFYSVALDAGRIGFTVPVKVANGKLSKPTIMLCNGSALSFNQDGLTQLYKNNSSDYKAAAAASPLYGLKPSDLITSIKEAMLEGNTAKAEDALNVLKNAGDEKAYAVGFTTFLNGLNVKTAAPVEKTCDKIIKNASSTHPICSHTGLPVHKTYVDKDGNCRPLYRKGMDEGYEAATFMNHKIFG